MQSVETLNQQFAIDQHLSFTAKPEGFLVAEVANRHAVASIALQGAHVMTFQPQGQEPVIWLSPQAKFAPGKSIRGGVPICWPWFGAHAEDPAKPGHGYARTVPWAVTATSVSESGETCITFALVESDATRAHWPHATPVQLQITVGAALHLELITTNNSSAAITLGEALHTYFNISDIGHTAIHGLDGCDYYDKMDNMQRKQQSGALQIAAETDRVYVNTNGECVIEDPGFKRRIRIAAPTGRSVVVWNPWIEKSAQMGDFGGEEGYRRMVCVESGNALDNCVDIAPGGEHRLGVTYRVEGL